MNPEFSREWLETNGIGGFASGTVAGANSRRYHAFLCAATRAPQERAVLVSKIEETVFVGEQTFELGVNFWPGTISPRGDKYLKSFSLDPLPRWIYEIPLESGILKIEKTVWMPHETNTSVAQYRVLEGPACQISIRPFVTGRDYHSNHHANSDFNIEAKSTKNQVKMQPYSHLPAIHFLHEGKFEENGAWFYFFEWPIEAERGLDCHEDAWTPGVFNIELGPKKDAIFAASTSTIPLKTLRATKNEVIERRTEIGGNKNWDDAENRLRRAADQTIVKREDGLFTVLAGYHWFTDWGRDTMIALPGLCLTTGRFEVAASILKSFAAAMSQGMIPNRFPEAGEVPDTNTVDATLWFFHAIAQFGEISGDWETVRELYPMLCDSLEWHLTGTRYGIQADPEDGLLRAGDANSQLTWMDAKIGDTAFTPRNGKAVEIQALWHNALCELANMARRFDDSETAGICVEWTRKVEANFAKKFWNEAESCLYDCIDGDFKDGAIRPNQIFAVSLPHHLLSHEQEKSVVEVVERELLTPHGLRSLSPRDSRYRGIYIGDSWSRDSAYHQGTVWGWPIGGFLSAYLRVNEDSETAKSQVRLWLAPLLAHLDEAGVGSISEIFDGDAPHAPRGCIAQAWSVSEVLRVYQESK
ncbi:glycogen debranching enzyme, putative [Abditibacterium utsteinense]|uniref:Glycogen debranching enzyme, putative n=1 Tax=Abditibacterium utsteinense TaxID=1960156 RepID=A0A2S8SP78_9BACT|nr:amylo-alpha-1,6-glucosidase [Abditibacterium utsteinense]PQV62584.1 glycogen debranching enzyme, putative [Abditibacterium utsteinense]